MDQNPPDDAHNNDQLHNGVEQFRPVRPERPDDESTGKGRRKSSLSIIMAGGAAVRHRRLDAAARRRWRAWCWA